MGSLFNKLNSQLPYFLCRILAIKNIAKLTNECPAINKNDKYNENSLFNKISKMIETKSINKKFINTFTILRVFTNNTNNTNIDKLTTIVTKLINIFPENTIPKLNK